MQEERRVLLDVVFSAWIECEIFDAVEERFLVSDGGEAGGEEGYWKWKGLQLLHGWVGVEGWIVSGMDLSG